MSAVLRPAFGDRVAIRLAEIGNFSFRRALRLGYSRTVAQNLARVAKKVAMPEETPAQVALRIVPPRSHSATVRHPGPYRGDAA